MGSHKNFDNIWGVVSQGGVAGRQCEVSCGRGRVWSIFSIQAGNIHTWKCSPFLAALLPAGAAGGTGMGVLPVGIPGAS